MNGYDGGHEPLLGSELRGWLEVYDRNGHKQKVLEVLEHNLGQLKQGIELEIVIKLLV